MKTKVLGHVYALIVVVLIAFSFISSSKLAQIVNPISLTLLRFVIAIIILIPFVLMQKEWFKKLKMVAVRGAIIGLFYALYFIAFFKSLKSTTTLHTGTLYTLVPLLTAIFSIFLFKQPLSKKRFVVYLMGAIGTAWVIFDGNIKQLISFSLNDGDLIFMIAVLSTCAYSLLMKALYKKYFHMVTFVFSVLGSGAIWMFFALLLFEDPLNWERIRGEYIFHMAYLAIGCTVITFWLYQQAILNLDPTKVTAYIYLTPAFVAIFAYLLDVEPFPNFSVQVGVIISIIATVLLQCDRSTIKRLRAKFSK